MNTEDTQALASTQDPAKAKQLMKEEMFRKFIEVEVLRIIKEQAEKGETDPAVLQEIAQYTLEMIKPGMSLEELYRSAMKLDDKYSILGPVVIKVMREYEEKYEQRAVDHVSSLIKAGKFDEANSMVQKVLEYKML